VPNPNAGLLGHAYRWSAALGALCVSGWVALSAAELGHWAAAGGELAHPLGLLRDALARAVIGCLVVHVGARVVRGQRRLAEQLDSPGRGYADGFADGLARRPASGRHLSVVDGPGDPGSS